MDTLILKVVFTVFLLLCMVVRYPHARRNKNNHIISDRKTRQERVLLGGAFLGMMVFPMLYVFTGLFEFANYTLPIYLHVTGMVLLIPALWLFYRSHKDLGRNWSATLEIRSEHSLVTNGVYKYMRHPMYSACWLWVICQALLLNNFIGGLTGLLAFGMLYFLRISKEEAMMEREFGEQYQTYKSLTHRVLPKF